MTLVNLSLVLLALAAILGAYLLSLVLQDKPTPKGIVFIHGPLAAAGLIVLIIAEVRDSIGAWPSIILFAGAALGGLWLFYKDITGGKIPKWLGVVHGSIAILAYILLLIQVFGT